MAELNDMSCGEFADVAAELALGVLTGRERAQAIAHLDGCDSCRENVRQLTMTGEELVGLLPASEPPLGFETRVMERLGLAVPSPVPATATQRGPVGWARRFGRKLTGLTRNDGVGRTRRMLAVAAVAVVVIVSGVAGWGLHSATSSPPGSPLASAALVSATHRTVGQIYLYNGKSRWMYMSVNMDSGTGTVICQVEGPSGRLSTIGSFRLANGYGYWGSPAPAASGPLTGARLVSANGTVLATATFPQT